MKNEKYNALLCGPKICEKF